MTSVAGTASVLTSATAALAMLALQAAAPVHAGEVADLARQAEDLLHADEPSTAFDAMDAAVDAFWRAAPLVIEDAHFDPAPDNATFAPASEVGIQLKPLGYGFSTDGDVNRIALDADVEIRTPGGLILAKSDGFGRLKWKGAGKNRNFAGRVSIAMPELKTGDYEFHLTLTDVATRKTAAVVLPFSVE